MPSARESAQEPRRGFKPQAEHDSVAQAQDAARYGVNVFAPTSPEALVLWKRTARLKDFRVVSCGYFGKATGHHWERDGLEETVLIYCVSGQGTYWEGGRTSLVHAGDVLYCAPRSHHRYAADAKEPWSIYWLHLAGPGVAPFVASIGLTRQAPITHVGRRPDVTALFDELFTLRQVRYGVEDLQALQSCARHLLSRLALAQRFAPEHRAQAQGLGEIMEEMSKGIDGGFSLTKLAARYGSSPGHFIRVFRRQTGETPAKYYSRQQIRRACMLLTDSKLRIKEIAAKVGFDDPYHFSRVFRQVVGSSPRGWRGGAWGRL